MTPVARTQHPFLHLLIPWAAGIALGIALPQTHAATRLFPVVALVCVGVLAFAHLSKRGKGLVFSAAFHLCLLSAGGALSARQMNATRFPFNGMPQVCQVVVDRQPEEKPRTMMCRVTVRQTAGTPDAAGHSFLLYVASDSLSRLIRPGDRLLVEATFSPPRNRGIPHEFDYASYLRRQGISGTAYVAAGHWRTVGRDSCATLAQRMEKLRRDVVSRYQRLGFHGDNLAILSALTVGVKNDLSDELREVFSVAGVSHVLALSGMHIGILCALLLFLFRPLWGRTRWGKPLSIGVVVVLLWGFALLTGFPASAVRAVVMFSVLAVSQLFPNRPATLNILACTAFFMLLCRPLWLLDVGFQLSFTAVASIATLYPLLAARLPKLPPHHRLCHRHCLHHLLHFLCRFGRWILARGLDLMLVSVAAQIGTAPLVAFYFHHFSVHFLLSNLFVVPLVSLIVYGSIALLLLTPLAAAQQLLANLLRAVIDGLAFLVRQVASWPGASIDGIWIGAAEVALLFAVLLAAMGCVRRLTARRTAILLAMACLWAVYRVGYTARRTPEPGIVFYNVENTPAALCIGQGRQAWIASPERGTNLSRLTRAIEPLCLQAGMGQPTPLRGDTVTDVLAMRQGILSFAGKRVCFAGSNSWQRVPDESRLTVDALYVYREYWGDGADLLRRFQAGQVIADSGLPDSVCREIEAACREHGVPFIRLAEKGFHTIRL